MVRALHRITLAGRATRHEVGPLRYVTAMGMATSPLAGLSVPVNIVAFEPLAMARLLALPAGVECELLAQDRVDVFPGADGIDRAAYELTVEFVCEREETRQGPQDGAPEASDDERPTLH